MKTVVVFATIENGCIKQDVVEHSVFGAGYSYETASDFIKACRDLWKKHCTAHKITNVVIEG